VFVLRTFHVDHAKWERFGALAESQGSSRAAELRKMIDRSLGEQEAA
jgi:hypothetical protein